MIRGVRLAHVNLIARDWRSLARFYQGVFGYEPVPPERDLHGADFDAGTGLSSARARGIHLRLPTDSSDGPTLEIFEYSEVFPRPSPQVNSLGYGHFAFSVASVPDALANVLASGGTAVGQIVTIAISVETTVTWCYVRDPEGNIVELQSRSSIRS